MYQELTVGAAFLIVWRRINDAKLSRHRRKAALVALVLNELEVDVLLETIQEIRRRPPADPLFRVD